MNTTIKFDVRDGVIMTIVTQGDREYVFLWDEDIKRINVALAKIKTKTGAAHHLTGAFDENGNSLEREQFNNLVYLK